MRASAICFVPQGDTMSSRRLFDALASGCVPAVLKCLGSGRTELALGNLPFPHSIEWRALALFLVPRRTRQSDREMAASGARRLCRVEEADWLAAWHANATALERMRAHGRLAFEELLDVEFGAEGVADGLLAELAHVLEETPAITWGTHPLTYAWRRQEYKELNLVMPPPHVRRAREPSGAIDESQLSTFTGDTVFERVG